MSYVRELAALIAANPRAMLGPELRTTRQVMGGDDPWQILGDPGGAVRRMLLRRYGREVVETLGELHARFQVTRPMAEAYWRWVMNRNLVGTYEGLRTVRRDAQITNLGDIFEIDHILEARIHRMLRDGIDGHILRSEVHESAYEAARARNLEHSIHTNPEFEIPDGAAMLVPSNEITAWRLHRMLAENIGPQELRAIAPRLYPHQGIGSKTSRFAQVVPWGLEGLYSYRELLDGSVWIVRRELGLPAAFARTIQHDLAESIQIGVRGDTETAALVLRWLRIQTGRRLTADSDELVPAVLQALPVRDLPDDFLRTWRFKAPVYPVPFEDVTREIMGG